MVRHAIGTVLTIGALGGLVSSDALARQAPAGYTVVKVCGLLPVAEVKKLAPWPAHVDVMKPEEESIGTTGSSCNYPSVFVQVLAYSQRMVDTLKKSSTLEPVPGVGDEAYVRNNKDYYAELVARVGPHLLTIQMSIERGKFESAKPSLIELGKLYAAKLR